ncbi:hypothetical protein ACQKEF_01415 [Pseudomonas oryzihabitans]|uniref:hypothetical protein n=1 Tax=Pseudomonas oryzihabitans TaxID=47885 RepID=UPI003CFFF3AB
MREFLCSSGALNADEIFHGVLNNDYRFYSYLNRRVQEDPNLIYPILQKECFYEYIAWLLDCSKGGEVVADVKYKNFNLLSSSYSLIPQEPFFIEFLRVTSPKVIHVRRRNKLAIILSRKISELTGMWAASHVEERPVYGDKIVLDAKSILDEIKSMNDEEELADRMLRSACYVHEIYYEEMFEGSNFSSAVFAVANELLPGQILSKKPANVKMNIKKLSEIVANDNEVTSAFIDAGYGWMLDLK